MHCFLASKQKWAFAEQLLFLLLLSLLGQSCCGTSRGKEEDFSPSFYAVNEPEYDYGPGEFIKFPLDFGAHQQLKVGPFPTRMESLKYAFSRMGKFSRSLAYIGAKARKMPCCTETIGTHTCNELRNRRPLAFRKRCKVDADFAILQCCQTCRTNIAELGRELFAHGLKSRHCFDRHNRNYCSHFIHQSGMWAANAGKLVNCNGESASLAFRVCRRSCGFCEPALYKTANRKCSKGSGVNPTVKGAAGKGGAEGDKTEGKGADGKEKATTTKSSVKEGQTSSKGPSTSSSSPSSSIASTTSDGSLTTATSSSGSKSPSSAAATTPSTGPSTSPRPSAPPPTAPPTLRPTVLPPSTPKLLPCPAPPPLPSLPPIPCRPLPPLQTLEPLTQATISIPEATPRPFRPFLPPPLPPIRPILPSFPGVRPLPIPPHPMPMPRPIMPLIPRPMPRPKPVPLKPQRPSPKITIEWKPMPPAPSGTSNGGGGEELGPWPEWPWPLPDEVIEAILNQLSGVVDKRAKKGKSEECGECVFDENGEEVKADATEWGDVELPGLFGFGGNENGRKAEGREEDSTPEVDLLDLLLGIGGGGE